MIAVLALLVWTFLSTPRRHLARIASAAAAIFTFNEALLGALLVLLHLTADNRSPTRAVYLSLHLGQHASAAGGIGALSAFPFTQNGLPARSGALSHLGIGILGLAATLMVGVTGALAALGDTLFPATSLSGGILAGFFGPEQLAAAPALHPPAHGAWLRASSSAGCWFAPCLAGCAQLIAGWLLGWFCFCSCSMDWESPMFAARAPLAADHASAWRGPAVDLSRGSHRPNQCCS